MINWKQERDAWAARVEAVPNDRIAREELAKFDQHLAELKAAEDLVINTFLDGLIAIEDRDAVDRAAAALERAWRAAA